jgi:hypothetical protein
MFYECQLQNYLYLTTVFASLFSEVRFHLNRFIFLFSILGGLQVLRLWLERKILPESVIRRHMDEIGGSNDDITVSYNFRRPSRAERSVDDPIREMEGMLVDEYGRYGICSTNFLDKVFSINSRSL